jgi:hypothetical protein
VQLLELVLLLSRAQSVALKIIELKTFLDVIKTRVHAAASPTAHVHSIGYFVSRETSSIVNTTRKILVEEGAGAFFKGIIPRCLIISPLFAITMTVYEMLQKRFG